MLLVVRGRLDGVRSWARRGLLPVWIVPDVGWTLVVPAGPAVTAAPYDDPVTVLGGRPLPARLRPALRLVADGPRAVLTVQGAGRREEQRWLVWSQGEGLQRVPELPRAALAEVVQAVGDARVDRTPALRRALLADGRTSADVVDDVLRALSLPGAGLSLDAVAAGDLPGAVRVEPDSRVTQRFDAYAAHEAELAGHPEDGR